MRGHMPCCLAPGAGDAGVPQGRPHGDPEVCPERARCAIPSPHAAGGVGPALTRHACCVSATDGDWDAPLPCSRSQPLLGHRRHAGRALLPPATGKDPARPGSGLGSPAPSRASSLLTPGSWASWHHRRHAHQQSGRAPAAPGGDLHSSLCLQAAPERPPQATPPAPGPLPAGAATQPSACRDAGPGSAATLLTPTRAPSVGTPGVECRQAPPCSSGPASKPSLQPLLSRLQERFLFRPQQCRPTPRLARGCTRRQGQQPAPLGWPEGPSRAGGADREAGGCSCSAVPPPGCPARWLPARPEGAPASGLALRVQHRLWARAPAPLTCDRVRVQPAAEGEDVQLVEPGDLLQELPAVGAQAGVQHRLAPAQLEVQDALRSTGAVSGGRARRCTRRASSAALWRPQPTATTAGAAVTTADG